MNARFARFVAVGGVAAAANFGSRIVFDHWTGFMTAVVLAFFVGLTTAFVLNRAWVFARTGRPWPIEAAWFAFINLLGLVQTVVVTWLLADTILPALGQARFVDETAHAAGIGLPLVTSYLGHKHLSFRRAAPTP
jgi:putative flippase GtrA